MLIAEEVLLLCTHPAKGTGTLATAAVLDPALRGAVLAELGLKSMIDVDGEGDAATITARPGSTGDEILDDQLALLRSSSGGGKTKDLVGSGTDAVTDLQERLLRRLVEAGTLSKRDRRVLGIIPRTTYPEADPEPERQIRERLARVLVSGEEPDERAAAVIALLVAADVIDKLSLGDDRRSIRQRGRELADGDALPEAVRQASEEGIAVMTAVAGSVAATTAANAAVTAGTT